MQLVLGKNKLTYHITNKTIKTTNSNINIKYIIIKDPKNCILLDYLLNIIFSMQSFIFEIKLTQYLL